MGDLATLGPAGGSRGVDDGGQVVGAAAAAGRQQIGIGDRRATVGQAVQAAVVQLVDRLEFGEVGGQPADGGGVVVGVHDHRPGARVGQDPADLLGRRRGVDGHRHRAGRPDRVVADGPFVAGGREQTDPVAGLDPGRDQSLGRGSHLRGELGGGDRFPHLVAAAQQRGVGAEPLGVAPHHVREVLGGLNLDLAVVGVLAHCLLSSGPAVGSQGPGEPNHPTWGAARAAGRSGHSGRSARDRGGRHPHAGDDTA